MITSSAYSFRVTASVKTSDKSLINNTNKIGHRQLPCTFHLPLPLMTFSHRLFQQRSKILPRDAMLAW